MFAIILFVIAIVIVALFSVQNAMPVAIAFLGWHFNASLAVIALLFFLASGYRVRGPHTSRLHNRIL